MGDTGEEQGRVGGMDEAGWSTVELSEEDEEEGERGGLGEVAVGSDSSLQILIVGSRGVSRAPLGVANRAFFTGTEQYTGLDAVSKNVAGQVRVVACKMRIAKDENVQSRVNSWIASCSVFG